MRSVQEGDDMRSMATLTGALLLAFSLYGDWASRERLTRGQRFSTSTTYTRSLTRRDVLGLPHHVAVYHCQEPLHYRTYNSCPLTKPWTKIGKDEADSAGVTWSRPAPTIQIGARPVSIDSAECG